jgi:hypothetical protein
MVDFKKYFLEYFKGNPITNPNPKNGKRLHVDPGTRKNINYVNKEYKHKHPLIDNITSGRADNVSLKGSPLTALLNTYDTHFEPGTKILGNSNVEAEMFEDEEGVPCAILKRRKQNAM